MKTFKYTAVNLNKEKISGTFIAKDERDLATQLAKQNLFLVSCSPYTGKSPSAFFTMGTGKVSTGELTTFCRQFAIMINSGISILSCLECLKDQAYSAYFKSLLQMIYDDVKSGVMLSDALNKHKTVFPEFFRSMVYVGEVSGKLEMVFVSLADYYERDAAIKRKTRSAFSYPLMLAAMTVGIVVLMLAVVIPTFRESLSSLEVEMNALTRVVYSISDFLSSSWKYLLVGLALIVLAVFIFSKVQTGARVLDRLKLRIPLVRKVQIDLITARFARAFSLLISSGMDIVEALDSVVVIMGNRDVAARFRKASEEVKHGTTLASAFEKYNLFPQIMLQMIAIGERTASLDDILNRSCAFFDEQVETTLNSVTSKIQPIMLLIMGVVIGTMFLAVYSPMISIMQGLV